MLTKPRRYLKIPYIQQLSPGKLGWTIWSLFYILKEWFLAMKKLQIWFFACHKNSLYKVKG